jgi:hypothetical protein
MRPIKMVLKVLGLEQAALATTEAMVLAPAPAARSWRVSDWSAKVWWLDARIQGWAFVNTAENAL